MQLTEEQKQLVRKVLNKDNSVVISPEVVAATKLLIDGCLEIATYPQLWACWEPHEKYWGFSHILGTRNLKLIAAYSNLTCNLNFEIVNIISQSNVTAAS